MYLTCFYLRNHYWTIFRHSYTLLLLYVSTEAMTEYYVTTSDPLAVRSVAVSFLVSRVRTPIKAWILLFLFVV
jgi:hypothetical protein